VVGSALLVSLPLFAGSCSLHERYDHWRYMRKLRAAVVERVEEHGPAARARLAPWFAAAGVAYPPRAAVLAGFKREKQLQLYAADEAGELRFVRSYPVLAASGGPGPKLAEGDRQVPEGVYAIELLNPFSRYHLSLRLDYPNDFDRARASEDGRSALGGDIMIHGSEASSGCLAVGDPAIEDLFVLAADVGSENVTVVVSPVDFRRTPMPDAVPGAPEWLPLLYSELRDAVWRLPPPAAAHIEPGATAPTL
jgi:hypothetical protein